MQTFTITDEQQDKFVKWKNEHQMTCKRRPGAVGDLFQVHFTPSGVGDFVSVHCPCGAELDLNDYDSF